MSFLRFRKEKAQIHGKDKKDKDDVSATNKRGPLLHTDVAGETDNPSGSLFSGLSFHVNAKKDKEVDKEQTQSSASHVDELQDLLLPQSEAETAQSKERTLSSGSKFNFINLPASTHTSLPIDSQDGDEGALTNKQGGKDSGHERQTSVTGGKGGQRKVTKTRKARKVGHDEPAGLSHQKERRPSATSEASDSSSFKSDDSLATGRSSSPTCLSGAVASSDISPERNETKECDISTMRTTCFDATKTEGVSLFEGVQIVDTAKTTDVAIDNTEVNPCTVDVHSLDSKLDHVHQLSLPGLNSAEQKYENDQNKKDKLDFSLPEKDYIVGEVSANLENVCHHYDGSVADELCDEQSIQTEEILDDSNKIHEFFSNENAVTKNGLEEDNVLRDENQVAISDKNQLFLAAAATQDVCLYDEKKDESNDNNETYANTIKRMSQHQTITTECKELSYKLELNEWEEMELAAQVLIARQKILLEDREKLTSARSDVLSNVRKHLRSRSNLKESITELQKLQKEAVEQEDFDRAEEINTKLDEIMEEADKAMYRHPVLDDTVNNLVLDFKTLLDSEANAYRDLLKDFEELIKEQNHCVVKKIEEEQQERMRKKNDLSKERTQLEKLMHHLQLDKDYLAKSEEDFRQEVEKKTSTLDQQKSALEDEKKVVEDEIIEVKKMLELLINRRDSLEHGITVIENKITDVRAEFEPQELTLLKERTEIQSREEALTTELLHLGEKENQLTEEDSSEEEKIVSIQTLINKLTSESKKILEIIEKGKLEQTQLHDIWDAADLTPVLDDDLLKFREYTEGLEKQVESLKTEMLQNQGRAGDLRSKTVELESQLGELFRLRQLAISERKFQDAKKRTEEINQLTLNDTQTKETLKELTSSIEATSSQLKTIEPEYEITKSKLFELEKSKDEAYLLNLSKVVSKIRTFLAKSGEELWIAPILSLEIETCQLIGKDLSEKYSIPMPDELMQPLETTTTEHDDDKEVEKIPSEFEIQQAKQQLDELETKLNDTIAAEDFDLAEVINDRIISIQKLIKE